ncbi:hypothetical protein [Mesorhizobium sp.]|uniref:hypothetical protein n=1 Tax=Mesorhizobium sp. TaxID=1871066 RepID=UPI0034258F3A
MVAQLDLLARSDNHLVEVVENSEAKNAHFRSLRDPTSNGSLPSTWPIRPCSENPRRGSDRDMATNGLHCASVADPESYSPCFWQGQSAAKRHVSDSFQARKL